MNSNAFCFDVPYEYYIDLTNNYQSNLLVYINNFLGYLIYILLTFNTMQCFVPSSLILIYNAIKDLVLYK